MLLHATRFAYADGAAVAADPDWTVPDVSAIEIATGWNATRALRISGVSKTAVLGVSLSAATQTLIVQAAVKFDSLRYADRFLTLAGGGSQALALVLTASGGFEVLDHVGTVVAQLPRGTLLPGDFSYMEVKAQRGSSARVQVRLNGAVLVDGYGVNTGSASPLDSVVLSGERSGTTWSELVVLDGVGPDYADFTGPSTRLVADGELSLPTTPAGGPNPLRELLGYLDARADGRPPPIRRRTWRALGTRLLDNPGRRWTDMAGGAAPITVDVGGTQNSWSPAGWASAEIVWITLSNVEADSQTIVGADPWVSWPVKCLVNSDEHFVVILKHDDSGEIPDNRFLLPSAEDLTIPPGQCCWLVRDTVSARWRAAPVSEVVAQSGESSDLIALL